MTAKNLLRKWDYIEHMLEAISRIQKYVKDMDEAAFEANKMVQDAVIRNMEIIGEAANNIAAEDREFVERHKRLKLDEAYWMRNALIHGYFSVNLLTVWNTVQNDLPVLQKQLADMLAQRDVP